MNTGDLERWEHDLDAVAGRLGSRRGWNELAPRARWSLHRPARQLAATTASILFCVSAGFWATSAWFVALGLVLAVLPDRVSAFRERRRVLASAGEGDLFALHRRELERAGAHQFSRALIEIVLAVVFALVALVARDSRPGWILAGVLVVSAVVRMLWLFPRPYRALRKLERDEVAT